jgi:hypothetical protein
MKNNELRKLALIFVAYFVLYLALFNIDRIFTWYYTWKYGQKYNNKNNTNNFKTGMSVDEACKVLGISKEELKKMNKSQLKKIYWKKAQEVHPDHQSGNEDLFKNLGSAWDLLKQYGYAA